MIYDTRSSLYQELLQGVPQIKPNLFPSLMYIWRL